MLNIHQYLSGFLQWSISKKLKISGAKSRSRCPSIQRVKHKLSCFFSPVVINRRLAMIMRSESELASGARRPCFIHHEAIVCLFHAIEAMEIFFVLTNNHGNLPLMKPRGIWKRESITLERGRTYSLSPVIIFFYASFKTRLMSVINSSSVLQWFLRHNCCIRL